MTLRKVIVIAAALVLTAITTYEQVQSWKAGGARSGYWEARIEAEFALKAALMYDSMGMQSYSGQFWKQAKDTLSKEILKKSPDYRLRWRLGILEGEDGHLSAARFQFIATRITFDPKRQPTADEIRLISALTRVYSGDILSKNEVPALRSAINPEKDWFRRLAMVRAYRNARMDREATELRSRMERAATIQVLGLTLLMFLLLLGGMAGLAADGYFIVLWKSGKLRRLEWQVGSWTLFEAFIIWMALYTGVHHGLDFFLPNRSASVSQTLILTILGGLLVGYLSALVITLSILQSGIRHTGSALKEVGLRTKHFQADVVWGVAGYLGSLPVLATAVGLNFLLIKLIIPEVSTPTNPAVGFVLESKGFLSRLLSFLLITVVGPFIEEVVFRGLLYGAVRRKWGVGIGILFSSTLFALLHQQLPLGFLPIFALGAIFALLYESRGSLIPNIVAHSINNGILFIFMLAMAG